MDQKNLKRLRLFLPGVMAIIIGNIYYNIITGQPLTNLDFGSFTFPAIGAFAVGALFYLIDLRFLITSYSHKLIDLNIKKHMIQLYTPSLSEEDEQFLYTGNRLKNIFYKIVDNDESLSKKAQNVMFNGIIWTSTADLVIIAFFFSIIFLFSVAIFEDYSNELLKGGFILILIAFISLLAHGLAFFKHIKLSNEQIEVIENHFKNRVNELINDNLKNR